LALGVAAGVALPLLGGDSQIDLAGDRAEQPRHPVRLHGRERGVETAAAERAHLVERAGGQHGIEARIDAAVELGALGIEKDLDCGVGGERGRHAVTMPVGERTAGRQDHLERAGDAGAIARPEALRGRRITVAELGVERRDAFALEPAPDR
jgi:hypothetical protein